jgi:hypothetical protein
MSKGVANTLDHQKNIQKINPRLLILICKVQKIFCLHLIKIQTIVQPTLKTGDICEIRRDLSYLEALELTGVIKRGQGQNPYSALFIQKFNSFHVLAFSLAFLNCFSTILPKFHANLPFAFLVFFLPFSLSFFLSSFLSFFLSFFLLSFFISLILFFLLSVLFLFFVSFLYPQFRKA